MSEEPKTTVSDYIKALFTLADNMEQPCEQDERQRVLVAANELKAAWERERVEIAVRAATDAVHLTDEKWIRNCANVAKLREALEKVHGYLGKLIRDGLVEDAPEASDLADDVWDALHAAPVRNCDKPEFTAPGQALAALKSRFPVREWFTGFRIAVGWLLKTTDFRLENLNARVAGSAPEGGRK